MRTDILMRVCCPACGSRLGVEAIADQSDDEIVRGRLRCTQCDQRYPIENRMPWLYTNDEWWGSKAREAEGWVALHKQLGIYEQPEDSVDLKIPYYHEGPWPPVARQFDIALGIAALSGREVVLDLGAGRGWAAKHFARAGCSTIAIDVVTDDQVGLGRAYALMQHAGVRFDPVIGDSENLPFYPNTFDLVFCAAVLHHTSDLPRLLQSVYQVLKPNGRLIAINEPCISLHENPQWILRRDAARELACGINERRPHYLDYWKALHGAGFAEFDISFADAYGLSDDELARRAASLGAIPPRRDTWRARQIRHMPRIALGYYLRWRTARLRDRLPAPRSPREALQQAILFNKGAGVIIVAHKPGA